MNAADEHSIMVLHFDDEIDVVAPISASVVNIYLLHVPSWVNEGEILYDDYVKRLVLRPSNVPPLAINFLLVDSLEECQVALRTLTNVDIAIFDLMRENINGKLEHVGLDLYKAAIKNGFPSERVFILTGFPHLIALNSDIPSERILVKPIAPSEVANRIVSMLPAEYSPYGLRR